MHVCVHDNRNGRKTVGVPSAAMARLTPFIVTKKIFFSSKRSSLSTDGNTIMNLPRLPGLIVFFINLSHFYLTAPIRYTWNVVYDGGNEFQGDKIEPFFTYWATICCWQFFNDISISNIWATFFPRKFRYKWVWARYILGDFLNKLIGSPWTRRNINRAKY
jgi:hypothetical protein